MLWDESGVVRAELGALLNHRPASLAGVKQSSAAGMLGHHREFLLRTVRAASRSSVCEGCLTSVCRKKRLAAVEWLLD
jgi:hypothetical protein